MKNDLIQLLKLIDETQTKLKIMININMSI